MKNTNRSIDLKEHALILFLVCIIGLIINHTYQYASSNPDMSILKKIILSPTELFSGVYDGALGMLFIYIMCIIGLIIAKFAPFYLPSIAWISLVAIISTSPISPIDNSVLFYTDKVASLPLTTAILAYAGFAIADKEVEIFKSSGMKIILVSLLVFIGTYLGSAVISSFILSATGV